MVKSLVYIFTFSFSLSAQALAEGYKIKMKLLLEGEKQNFPEVIVVEKGKTAVLTRSQSSSGSVSQFSILASEQNQDGEKRVQIDLFITHFNINHGKRTVTPKLNVAVGEELRFEFPQTGNHKPLYQLELVATKVQLN